MVGRIMFRDDEEQRNILSVGRKKRRSAQYQMMFAIKKKSHAFNEPSWITKVRIVHQTFSMFDVHWITKIVKCTSNIFNDLIPQNSQTIFFLN